MGTKSISKQEYDALNSARDNAESAGLLDVVHPDTDGATLSMLGAGYRIGSITVPQFNLGTVALFSVAGVSLDDDADMSVTDMAVMLYVLAHGNEACQALMGVKQRLAALEKLEHLAAKSPEMFQRYLNKIDEIGGDAHAAFESEAIAFLGEIEGASIEDISDVLGQMADDFAATMGLLPDAGDDDDGKKN